MPRTWISGHFMYITMLLKELIWLLSKMRVCVVELCRITLQKCYMWPKTDFDDSSGLVTRPFNFLCVLSQCIVTDTLLRVLSFLRPLMFSFFSVLQCYRPYTGTTERSIIDRPPPHLPPARTFPPAVYFPCFPLKSVYMCVVTDNLGKRQMTWIGCYSRRGAIQEYDSKQRVGTAIHATSFRRFIIPRVCKINWALLQTPSIMLDNLMYLIPYKTLLLLQL
jgi:hypothetical protein